MLRKLGFTIVWTIVSLLGTLLPAMAIARALHDNGFFVHAGIRGDITAILLVGTPHLIAILVFVSGLRGRLPGTKRKTNPQQ